MNARDLKNNRNICFRLQRKSETKKTREKIQKNRHIYKYERKRQRQEINRGKEIEPRKT